MGAQGVIPSPDAWSEIQGSVRHHRQNRATRKARRAPRRRNVGSCACPEVHEISTTGSPSSGTFDLTYDLGGSDTVTINWDDTAAEVKTAMETHTGVTTGDVSCSGGPLPNVAVYVVFTSTGTYGGQTVELPTISDSLNDGDPRLRKASSYDWTA